MENENNQNMCAYNEHNFIKSFWHGTYCTKCLARVCEHGKLLSSYEQDKYVPGGFSECPCGELNNGLFDS